jgi:hypothetical protein
VRSTAATHVQCDAANALECELDLVDKLLRSAGTMFPAFRASGRSRWRRSTAFSGLLGIAWSPVVRTPKPKPREVEQPQPDESQRRTWMLIGGLEAEIEDLRQRVQLERRYVSSLADGDETDDLETAGNIVCMPGRPARGCSAAEWGCSMTADTQPVTIETALQALDTETAKLDSLQSLCGGGGIRRTQ